ncbi:hypothetical protein RsTz2092_00170 [Deferribacterales bacterium RsTz2092]|nr:hypothetical protein AGMMS49941_00340 [Deferribacterales bacterium]
MTMLKHIALLAIFTLVACSQIGALTGQNATEQGTDKLVNGKPYWFWAPSADGVLGAVGESGTHIDGISAQRKLAMARAIENLAMQKGVKVDSTQVITSSQNASGASSGSIDSKISLTVSGVVLNVIVRSFWQDPQTGKLLVWVTEYK